MIIIKDHMEEPFTYLWFIFCEDISHLKPYISRYLTTYLPGVSMDNKCLVKDRILHTNTRAVQQRDQ